MENGREGALYNKRNRFPRVWVIRYKDGHIESAGTSKEGAASLARQNAEKHGGIEVIT